MRRSDFWNRILALNVLFGIADRALGVYYSSEMETAVKAVEAKYGWSEQGLPPDMSDAQSLDFIQETLDEKEETPTIEPVLSEADKIFLEKMDKLIYNNLSNEELSAKFLTDHLAMSRASLYNKVKTLTGMGVNDYINRIRIERSVHLLTNTELSINEISYEVGFSYPRYFSTSFKQMKGMTPTKFKEENRKKNNTL